VFVDSAGTRRAGRYRILPVAGIAHLDSAAAAKAGANYMFDELRRRIARGPIRYTLAVQLAEPGDPPTTAPSFGRTTGKRVTLGTIKLTAIAPDNGRAAALVGVQSDLPHRRHPAVGRSVPRAARGSVRAIGAAPGARANQTN